MCTIRIGLFIKTIITYSGDVLLITPNIPEVYVLYNIVMLRARGTNT